MEKQRRSRGVHRGDEVVVDRRSVDATRRTGVVLDVLNDSGPEHYRVRWEDGHESIFYPGGGASIVPRRSARRKETS